MNTAVHLIMLISYLTINFKGTYSLSLATILLVHLSCGTRYMYMTVGIQLCLEKRTVRSDETEARTFFHFVTFTSRKVCIYVFVFVRDLNFFVSFIFLGGLPSYLLLPAEA